jgi:hypothetical protein
VICWFTARASAWSILCCAPLRLSCRHLVNSHHPESRLATTVVQGSPHEPACTQHTFRRQAPCVSVEEIELASVVTSPLSQKTLPLSATSQVTFHKSNSREYDKEKPPWHIIMETQNLRLCTTQSSLGLRRYNVTTDTRSMTNGGLSAARSRL